MKLTGQELHNKLVNEYKIIGEKGIINFSLKDLTISIETKDLTIDLEALLDKLRMIDGVKRLEVLGQV